MQRSTPFAEVEDDWESQVSTVWEAAGASEVMVRRMLVLGAKWQKGALGEIYRDPAAVCGMVGRSG